MESAYTLANRELEQIRTANREEHDTRHSQVLLVAPQLADIESRLMICGTQLLKCVLNQGKNFDEIKSSIQALQREKAELLKEFKFSEDFLDEIYTCPDCRDTGFIDGKRCSCLKQLILKHISENSNLTEYMRKQTFENFDFSLFANQGEDSEQTMKVMRVACEKAIAFADTFDTTHENFLLLGNAGTGKTYLSSCIANRALERGKTVYYQTAFTLFDIFEKVKFSKIDSDDLTEITKYVYDVDLLIIDDLGTEFATQFTLAVFFDIINLRLTTGKSTIISSNLDFDSLSDVYSQRITSRFIGDYTIVQTFGKDLRAIAKNAKRVKKQ